MLSAICMTEDLSVIESEPFGESISGCNCSAQRPYGVGGSIPGVVMV